MRIRELTLRNVKLLADEPFSFVRPDGSIRTWTVLLGDNGVCKTTVLQAIALASSGAKMARGLVEVAGDYATQALGDAPVVETSMKASFETSSGDLEVKLSTEPRRLGFRGNGDTSRIDNIRDEQKPGFFVVGYGVGRRLPKPGEVAIPRDRVTDRVKGLFDPNHKMLGIDFLEALEKKPGLQDAYARTLHAILMQRDANGEPLMPWLAHTELAYGGDSVVDRLRQRRLYLDVGGRVPIVLAPHLLSQGYQSTLAWIADLLGHAFLDVDAEVDPKTLQGIVLLDEIDLHLHPTWQRRIVPILRSVFPRLQFIVTTHSPLVLTGFEADEIIGLELVDGEVVQRTYGEQPGLQTGSELMEGFFGVPTAGRPELLVKEREALELSVKGNRSQEEDQRLATLRSELAPYLEDTSFAEDPFDFDDDDEDDDER